jgi:hypothetical protein
MNTYKVILRDREVVTIRADYFKIIYDGTIGYDAHFYTEEERGSLVSVLPTMVVETFVGYVERPSLVVDVSALDTAPQDD